MLGFDPIYHIGEYYHYWNCKNQFKLVSVRGFIFEFERGHWCTDSVFVDLYRTSTEIQVGNEIQLSLF